MASEARRPSGRMTRAARRRIAADLPDWATVILLLVLGSALGRLAATNTELAVIALVIVVFLVVVATRPGMVAVAAFGLVFLIGRLGPGGAMSYTDALVAAASCLALPALARSLETRRVSMVQRGVWIYFVALVPTLVINADVKSALEWLHRLILVGGSLAVGAWLARERLVTVAFRLLLIVSIFFALAACVSSVRNGFAPAYPFGYHKNFVGGVSAITLILVLATPASFTVNGQVRLAALVVLTAGILATQSRGALLGAALSVLVLAVRQRAGANVTRRVFAGLLAAGLGVFAYLSISAQLQDSATFSTNSLGTRLRVEQRTRDIWSGSPIIGVGLRYYNIGDWGPEGQAANNAFDNELAEGGLVGTTGFVVFHGVLFVALARRRGPLATAALGAVAGHFLHGQVDIYWSAGTSSLPMMLAGVALASTPSPKERATGPVDDAEDYAPSSDSARAKI